jgi:DNA-binding GntR family transcriptional regulator
MAQAKGDSAPNELPPLTRPTATLLQTQTVSILREAILAGRLEQGSRLNEIDVSRELGISRGPLREALRILEEEGLVQSSPYHGARVVRASARDLVNVMEIRALLEPFATARAAARSSPLVVPALRRALEQMTEAGQAGDGPGAARAHTAFHGIFYEYSGNGLMNRVWQRLEAPVRLYLRAQQQVFESLDEVAADHVQLLRLVIAGEPRALRRETSRHVKLHLRSVTRLVSAEDAESEAAAAAAPNDRPPDRGRRSERTR